MAGGGKRKQYFNKPKGAGGKKSKVMDFIALDKNVKGLYFNVTQPGMKSKQEACELVSKSLDDSDWTAKLCEMAVPHGAFVAICGDDVSTESVISIHRDVFDRIKRENKRASRFLTRCLPIIAVAGGYRLENIEKDFQKPFEYYFTNQNKRWHFTSKTVQHTNSFKPNELYALVERMVASVNLLAVPDYRDPQVAVHITFVSARACLTIVDNLKDYCKMNIEQWQNEVIKTEDNVGQANQPVDRVAAAQLK